MRFLIVVPRFVERPSDYYSFPIGLAYISAALKAKGFDVECVNANYCDDAELKRTIVDKGIDVVCTGAISPMFRTAEKVFRVAREAKSDVVTIAGGGMVSAQPELMVDVLGLDYGVIGEGEATIVDLAQALCEKGDVSAVNGIVHRDGDGRIVRTAERPLIKDLDSIPWPDYTSFQMDRYIEQTLPSDFMYSYVLDVPREMPMTASRSCPYECTFCYLPMGRTYRERSLDSFFAELDRNVKEFRIKTLTIYDDLFAVKRDRLEEFCARIKPYGLQWVPQLRVNLVDEDILRMMKDAGCYYISYGIESASPVILKTMKKRITLEQIERAISMTKAARIGFQGNFLFGDTHETPETIQQTLDWWVKNPEYQIMLVPVGVYPGAELYEDAVKNGKIPDEKAFLEAGCPLFNASKNLTDDQYAAMLATLPEYEDRYRLLPAVYQRWRMGTRAGREVYRIRFECPHCKEIVVYENFALREYEPSLTGCRACHGRLWFPALRPRVMKYASLQFLTAKWKEVGPREFARRAARKAVALAAAAARQRPRPSREVVDARLPHFAARTVGVPPANGHATSPVPVASMPVPPPPASAAAARSRAVPLRVIGQ